MYLFRILQIGLHPNRLPFLRRSAWSRARTAAVWGASWFGNAAAGLPRSGEVQLDWRIVLFTPSLTGEIGVRMALGAQQWRVLLQVEGQGMALVAAGLTIGLAGTAIATRFMSALRFRAGSRDPLTFGSATATLNVVSLFACYLPTRRAAKVDPIIALRGE